MAYELNNLQLINISEEDDNLIAFHYRDSLKDFPLPLIFDYVNLHGQFEPVEPKRLSLDWDSAFFTCEGLLNTEALCMINKGFKKAESDLEILEAELFKDLKPNFHKLTKRSRFATKMMINEGSKVATTLEFRVSSSKRKKTNSINRKLASSPTSVLSPLSSSRF